MEHYQQDRNHKEIGNESFMPAGHANYRGDDPIRRREKLSGVFKRYPREAVWFL